MASPTVFVSSTFYDLRYAREALKRFIEQFGYVPVLSEDGAVFYDPHTTAADSCLKEVSNANLLVLLIGGRYGMDLPGTEMSVTNAEYQQAVSDKIPIFALVDQSTYNDYLVYQANRHNQAVLESIQFPNADSVKIFEFIDSVRTRTENNALVPFRTLGDVEQYLRSQWAGMMHEHVTAGTRGAQVVDTLGALQRMNERVELIASQILNKVGGTTLDRTYIGLMEALLTSSAVKDLAYFGAFARPGDVLAAETVQECAIRLGKEMRPHGDPDEDSTANSISSNGTVSQSRRRDMETDYDELRTELIRAIANVDLSTHDVLEYEQSLGPTPIRRRD